MNVGDKIKNYRKSLKLTQKYLAEKIDKSERMVQKYESGEVIPPMEILKKIADVLCVPLMNLVTFDELEKDEISIQTKNTNITSLQDNLANVLKDLPNISEQMYNVINYSIQLSNSIIKYSRVTNNTDLSLKLLHDLIKFIDSFTYAAKRTIAKPENYTEKSNFNDTDEIFNKINEVQFLFDNIPELMGAITIDLQKYNVSAQKQINSTLASYNKAQPTTEGFDN